MFHADRAEDYVWGGFLVFGLFAAWGCRILWRGLTNDVTDSFGHPNGSRWWWIIGGIISQIPLIAFTIFAYRQGYFGQ